MAIATYDRTGLHDEIRRGITGSSEELYRLVVELVRGVTQRAISWGADPADLVHDIYLSVFGAIQSGAVRSPERLPAYIMGTAQRQVCGSLRRALSSRIVTVEDAAGYPGQEPDPEQSMAWGETRKRVERLLRTLPAVDQAILRRFYFGEVPWQRIAKDLHLTPNQFRLRKHRALERVRLLANRCDQAE